MADGGSSVGIVVAPDFGASLEALARRMPVWVADTPANRAAADRIRRAVPAADMTTFAVGAEEAAEARCARVLGAVELHHGPCSCDPPCAALEVIGAAATPAVHTALAGIGFAVAAEWAGGFRAVRTAAESGVAADPRRQSDSAE